MGQVYLKDLIDFIQKLVWLISFGVTIREISRVEIYKKLLCQQKNILYFQGLATSLMVAQNQIFCPNCGWLFAVISRKVEKRAIFDILMTTTPRVNIITRQVTLIFSSSLWDLSTGIFHFCISRPSKLNSIFLPFALCSGL